jgi:hypothetical protein
MGPLLKQSQNTKKSLLEAECNMAGNSTKTTCGVTRLCKEIIANL